MFAVDVIKRNPSFIAYFIFGCLIIAAFVQADGARDQARRDTCLSALDQSLLLRDFIDIAVAASNEPRTEQGDEVIRKIYSRIELPPKICENTSIDPAEFFRRAETSTSVPESPSVTTPTTVITTVPASSTNERVVIYVPAPGPAPDRIDPPRGVPPSTTTTTSTTTTSTTAPPDDECPISVRGRCVNIPLGAYGIFLFGYLGI